MSHAASKRVLLGSAALLCYAAAVALAPSGVRSQLDVRPQTAKVKLEPRSEPAPVAVTPERDAFAPRAVVEDQPPSVLPSPPPAPRPAVPPPALRVPPFPVRRETAARVAAIATGAQPTAIVDDGGTARVVTVGDALDGSTIAAIADDGVLLGDGRRLRIQPPAPIR